MARIRMVTRTITVNVLEVMCVDTTISEVTTKQFELTGETLTNEKALKLLKNEYETDTFKLVAIQKTEVREEMYGLKETDFIKVAKKLDPATRKEMEETEQLNKPTPLADSGVQVTAGFLAIVPHNKKKRRIKHEKRK